MKAITLFKSLCFSITILTSSTYAFSNSSNEYYNNNIYFNNKLEVLKFSFDRWQQISQSEPIEKIQQK